MKCDLGDEESFTPVTLSLASGSRAALSTEFSSPGSREMWPQPCTLTRNTTGQGGGLAGELRLREMFHHLFFFFLTTYRKHNCLISQTL